MLRFAVCAGHSGGSRSGCSPVAKVMHSPRPRLPPACRTPRRPGRARGRADPGRDRSRPIPSATTTPRFSAPKASTSSPPATSHRVSPATLAGHDVVILGEMPLTASQVTMFSNWVTAGGNLIAMRPDKQLAGLLGLTDAASTLAERLPAGQHRLGPGRRASSTRRSSSTAPPTVYTLNGASSVATLYATATTATSNPAVTLRSVGANGGQAAAFTYDLARSIVYTRQGNPAWSGQDRDGDRRRSAPTTCSSATPPPTRSRTGSTSTRSRFRRPTSSSGCSRTSSRR